MHNADRVHAEAWSALQELLLLHKQRHDRKDLQIQDVFLYLGEERIRCWLWRSCTAALPIVRGASLSRRALYKQTGHPPSDGEACSATSRPGPGCRTKHTHTQPRAHTTHAPSDSQSYITSILIVGILIVSHLIYCRSSIFERVQKKNRKWNLNET